jgi:Na+/proline symporter
MSNSFGYFLILAYSAILLILVLGIKNRYRHEKETILTYILAGKEIPAWLLTTSVFSAWIWVTTIIGSAEATVLYGLTGAVGYSVGASVSFLVFIMIILTMQRMMPESTSFLEFVGERYSKTVKDLYYIFAILTTVYVAIEQAAGISFVLNGFFDTSYKKVAFLSVFIAIVYVVLTGMRGVLYNEFISFFFITVGFVIFVMTAFQNFSFTEMKEGLLNAQNNPLNANYNPDVLNLASLTGLRYSVMAVVIAFGQILFDPAYYIKASLAKNQREAKKAFLLGGIILWCPVGIVSAVTLGFVSIAKEIDFSDSLNISADIPTKLITQFLGEPMALWFSFFIICIGITTILHYLIGIQAIFTIDFYKNKIKPEAAEKDKIKFGKVIVILVGTFCGLIAISLEDISLLTIDMFCGVFFAAPCGALFAAIISKKEFKNLPVLSIFLGLCTGFYVWVFFIEDHNWAWFWGTMASFFIPMIFLFLCSFLIKNEYNFTRMRFWRP